MDGVHSIGCYSYELLTVHVCPLDFRVEVFAGLQGSPQHSSLWVNPHVLLRPAQQVSNRRGESIPNKCPETLVHVMPNGGCIHSKHNRGLCESKTSNINLLSKQNCCFGKLFCYYNCVTILSMLIQKM